jgi:hypothetical protein
MGERAMSKAKLGAAYEEHAALWGQLMSGLNGSGNTQLSFAPQMNTCALVAVNTIMKGEFADKIARKEPLLNGDSSKEILYQAMDRVGALTMQAYATHLAQSKGDSSNYEATGSTPYGSQWNPTQDPSLTTGEISPTYAELQTIEIPSETASPEETKRVTHANTKRKYILLNRKIVVVQLLLLLMNGVAVGAALDMWMICDEIIRTWLAAEIKAIDTAYGRNASFNEKNQLPGRA